MSREDARALKAALRSELRVKKDKLLEMDRRLFGPTEVIEKKLVDGLRADIQRTKKEVWCMDIRDKQAKCGGLHVKAKTDDVVWIDHNGEKLKVIVHGLTDEGDIALSFVGSRDFIVVREKVFQKMGITP